MLLMTSTVQKKRQNYVCSLDEFDAYSAHSEVGDLILRRAKLTVFIVASLMCHIKAFGLGLVSGGQTKFLPNKLNLFNVTKTL